jgi:YesN/AraC family two-component response regulator
MTRALIADDERLMRDQLRARLAEVWPELEIVGEAKNGVEAVELTAQLQPDLVFLDIRMPGTGVDAARQSRNCRPTTIGAARNRLHHRLRYYAVGPRAGRR